MILERGNMWDVFGHTDVFLITTNPIVTKFGAGVMGRGIALEMKNRYPDVPYQFGKVIMGSASAKHCGPIGNVDGQTIGYFMVKGHWSDPADPAIIETSVRELTAWLNYAKQHKPDCRFDLNFPGIGNGKLSRDVVLPLIEVLPDNVHVWEYA